jgi:hypothetical protein
MYQYDDSTAVSTLPTPAATGTPGFFSDGNPATASPATALRADFMNMLMLELVNLVQSAGLTLSKTSYNQVITAIKMLIESGATNYGLDSGVANAYAVAYAVPITAVSDGMRLRFKALHANTTASTLTPNPGVIAPAPMWGGAHSAFQGGEIQASGDVEVVWNGSLNTTGVWEVLESTGGALQVATASQSQHAVQFSQLTGLIGSMRNAKMYLAAASASATFTADQIIVGTALNGLQYPLASFNKAINLATVGAGGMDIGAAPASGFVALYAIYNPTAATASILATNATAALAPTIYGGANMPAGYTASALISVVPTTSGGLIAPLLQKERDINIEEVLALNASTIAATPTPVSISAAVPKNARSISGFIQAGINAGGSLNGAIAGDVNMVGLQIVFMSTAAAGGGDFSDNFCIDLNTPQVFFYTLAATGSVSAISFDVDISAYSI